MLGRSQSYYTRRRSQKEPDLRNPEGHGHLAYLPSRITGLPAHLEILGVPHCISSVVTFLVTTDTESVRFHLPWPHHFCPVPYLSPLASQSHGSFSLPGKAHFLPRLCTQYLENVCLGSYILSGVPYSPNHPFSIFKSLLML